jgi:hypothetical protein
MRLVATATMTDQILNSIAMQNNIMKRKRIYTAIYTVLLCLITSMAHTQIYPARDGSFIVLNDRPDKTATYELQLPGEKQKNFAWPSGVGAFTAAYREAELTFPAPLALTDEDLQKVWKTLEEMPVLAPCYQYSPAMLLALGQAAYRKGSSTGDEVEVLVSTGNEKRIAKKISRIDIITTVHQESKPLRTNSQSLSIDIAIAFPKNSFINGARVFKKPVGARDSVQVYPLVFTSHVADQIEMNIRDTASVIGEFIYSVAPTDQLGNQHPALPGIYAHNYNERTEPLIIDFTTTAKDKNILLQWTCTSMPRVRGFDIYRSHDEAGPFIKIASLQPGDTVFVDRLESTMQSFFYYIQVVDQHGKGTRSVTHFVTPKAEEKPIPPQDPLAVPDPNGVQISWPTYDAFHHVRGYYVFRQATGSTDWEQVSPFLPVEGVSMHFLDTAQTLTAEQEYAYGVKSESTSYVLSDMSSICHARPGKARKVSTPAELGYRFLDNGQLLLYWDDVRKYDPYVTQYHLYEMDADGKQGKEVPGSPFDVSATSWAHPGKHSSTAGYAIQAADAWGNKSSMSVAVKPLHQPTRIAPRTIVAKPTSTGFQLTWASQPDSEVKSIELYKINADGAPLLVKSLRPDSSSFAISDMMTGQVETYYITYKLANGAESERSEVVILRK